MIELRRAHGWTQEAAAEHLGIDVSTLRRIERGTHFITLRTLVRIANAYGTRTRELLDDPTSVEPRRPGRPRRTPAT